MKRAKIEKNIILIGPMGAGKSSVGRSLATRLKKKFIDSDVELERHLGVSIDWMFDIEGEAIFRERESEMIQELAKNDNMVLATGGGSIIHEVTRKVLPQHGIIVYLKTSVETQTDRTNHLGHRPMLRSGDKKVTLQKLFQERQALYLEIADITIQTDNDPIINVVNDIIDALTD